jgi:hypothetical protein
MDRKDKYIAHKIKTQSTFVKGNQLENLKINFIKGISGPYLEAQISMT